MLSLDQIRSRARQWLSPEFNEETREEVTEMLEKDEKNSSMPFTRTLNSVPVA